ncbi:MAG: IPT/TIG domain-containing protein [Tannerella sp.]|nr:IPT/TIG domain-containing protein [Tannerella sp.]
MKNFNVRTRGKTSMTGVFTKLLGMALLSVFCLHSCNDDNNTDTNSKPYDSGKPLVCESFTPLEGGIATRVILKGDNFGNDPEIVKVYFNSKPAPVVGCNSGNILVITPRQPGDTCVISLVIGQDSTVFAQKYIYHTREVVSTIVGQRGTTEFKEGSFGEATFVNPSYLTVDDEGNLFLAHQDSPHSVVMISQQNRSVTQLFLCPNKPNAPSTDITGRIIVVPADGGDTYKDTYFEFDADAQWTPRTRKILHPTPADVANGIPDFNINLYKHSFTICMLDSMVYARSNRDGYLLKFNPKTRMGQAVNVNGSTRCNPLNSDTYLVFDPVNKSRMYCASTSQHCIHYFDILTGETGVYAGKSGESGWKDGKIEDARFNGLRQMVLDNDGNLIVADVNNHCIRQISPEGIVTTIVGIAGKSGYQDGNSEDALFNSPWGLCIDRNDGSVYIADRGNKCIRKLTRE